MSWDHLVGWRRALHHHAEPGWGEFWTSAFVAAHLETWGYRLALGRDAIDARARMGVPAPDALEREYRRALEWGAAEARIASMQGGLTGAVARLDSGRAGPTVALRFDLDANEGLREATDAEHAPARDGFAALHPNAQHSCAHDGHTAMRLGMAQALAARAAEWRGRVILVFQPAEEGARGAQAMVRAGV